MPGTPRQERMADMAEKKLPLREEVNPQYKWRMEDMFPSNDAWEAEYAQAGALIQRAESFAGKLSAGAGTLADALDAMAEASLAVERLFVYARMRRDENNANTLYQGMADRAAAINVKLESALSYLDPEILAMDEAMLQGFIQSEPRLAVYRQFLDRLARRRAHTLSQSEERLLAMAGEVLESPHNIFVMLNNADMKFPTVTGEDDEPVQLTHGRYIPMMESRNRDVRKGAFQALYATYLAYRNTLATTYGSSVKGDVFGAQARNFPSSLAASLHGDAVPVEVYDNLIATVRANLPLLHRYMALRKRALGVDELHMYDLYVPIVAEVDMKMTYAQACDMLREGLSPLGPDYIAAMSEGLNTGWVDVLENEGKSSGAYSWGVWGTHPYVLMNWNDTLDNAYTLAHELGHAMHSYLSDRLPYMQAQYPILLAEVASTFNECLFLDYMLKRTQDKDNRLYLLNHFLEQVRTTVIRQVMFAEFEKITHEMAERGEALTGESLSAVYRQLNADYYGQDMVLDSEIDMEWARIPHFYGAFYVYKYATGFASAVALADGVLTGGEPARQRYLKFLGSGGTDYPLNLLREAGVDLLKPDAVEACFARFAAMLEEMEALL